MLYMLGAEEAVFLSCICRFWTAIFQADQGLLALECLTLAEMQEILKDAEICKGLPGGFAIVCLTAPVLVTGVYCSRPIKMFRLMERANFVAHCACAAMVKTSPVHVSKVSCAYHASASGLHTCYIHF